MSTPLQYGNEDSQIKHLLRDYRLQDRNIALSDNLFPQFSAVRQQNNNQNILGGSELSWLDKMAEINDKMCDQTIVEDKDDNRLIKPINSMKFSFNQNYTAPIKNQENKQIDKPESQVSLRQIYFQQLEKQSQKIKSVQQARKELIDSIDQKRKVERSKRNKQNLVGSIKRNSNYEERSKHQIKQSRSTYTGQAAAQPKSIINQHKKSESKVQEEPLSLKNLQQSLANRKIQLQLKQNAANIIISKDSYLQANSQAKNTNNAESSLIVKQQNEKHLILNYFLELLFEQLDRSKSGLLSRENCNFQRIMQNCKIVFGKLFVQIKFKGLTVNKQEFSELGKQILKQLDSEQFYRFIEDQLNLKIPASTIKLQIKQYLNKNESYSKAHNQKQIKKSFQSAQISLQKPQRIYKQTNDRLFSSQVKKQINNPIANHIPNQKKKETTKKIADIICSQVKQSISNKSLKKYCYYVKRQIINEDIATFSNLNKRQTFNNTVKATTNSVKNQITNRKGIDTHYKSPFLSNKKQQSYQFGQDYKNNSKTAKPFINANPYTFKEKQIHASVDDLKKLKNDYQSLDKKYQNVYTTSVRQDIILDQRYDKVNMIVTPKKHRNISQSMIIQHKRNLQELLKLNQQVQNHLSRSRRVLQQNQNHISFNLQDDKQYKYRSSK